MPDIRANRVPKELVRDIKQAVLDREMPSIREATIEAFQMWLSAGGQIEATPKMGQSINQDQLSLAHTILPALESAEQAIHTAISHARTAAAQAVADRQPVEDGVVPRKATRRRKTGDSTA